MKGGARSWSAAACLSLAACAAGANGAADVPGAAGSTGCQVCAGSGTAGTGGVAMCQVDVLPIVPMSFDGLQAGPGATMRVRGAVTGAVPAAFGWQWTVSLADGSPVPVSAVDQDPSLVEFATTSAGTYTIAVTLTGTPCAGLHTITAARPGAPIATFRMHVTPPATAGAPEQDLERQVMGGTPSGGNTLTLDDGILVGINVVRAAGGAPLPSYVRLTEAASGAVVETRTTASGPTLLRVAQGSYSAVVVPDGDVAPIAFAARDAGQLGLSNLALDDGVLVTGTVSDGAGQPVPDATVVLRDGDDVSTTGTTSPTGTFSVRARAGAFGVTVVSPLASGGLESRIAATASGLVVAATAPPPPLAIKVQPGPLVTGIVVLSAKDPASLTPATSATLTPAAPLAGVATFALGPGAPQEMASDVRFSLHPDADGTLTTGGVPCGVYQLTVFPATGASADAVTTTRLDLSTGSLGPLAVPLAQKVLLEGKLLPAAESWGVRLEALDELGLPVVSDGDVAQDGSFQIAVSPERSYLVHALPKPDQPLARMSFPVVAVGDADLTIQDRSMPAALLYAGRVVDLGAQGVGAALVQAYCLASDPGCADATTPVAETVTRSDGTFELMLPDPAGTP